MIGLRFFPLGSADVCGAGMMWLFTIYKKKSGNFGWNVNGKTNLVFPNVKLIDKMSLGAGALRVEGPIAQNGSIALEVTMATKRAPTTRHRHTERVQWNTYHNPYLPIQGWEEWEKNQQISQAVNSNDQQAKQSRSMQSHVSPCRPSSHPAQACQPGAQPLTR